jgi:hypothetical protein
MFFEFIGLREVTMKELCSDFAERGKMISNGP